MVGDTVYCLMGQGNWMPLLTSEAIIERIVTQIMWDGRNFEIYCDRPIYWDNISKRSVNCARLYDCVFITKEAAEARIKQIQEWYK